MSRLMGDKFGGIRVPFFFNETRVPISIPLFLDSVDSAWRIFVRTLPQMLAAQLVYALCLALRELRRSVLASPTLLVFKRESMHLQKIQFLMMKTNQTFSLLTLVFCTGDIP